MPAAEALARLSRGALERRSPHTRSPRRAGIGCRSPALSPSVRGSSAAWFTSASARASKRQRGLRRPCSARRCRDFQAASQRLFVEGSGQVVGEELGCKQSVEEVEGSDQVAAREVAVVCEPVFGPALPSVLGEDVGDLRHFQRGGSPARHCVTSVAGGGLKCSILPASHRPPRSSSRGRPACLIKSPMVQSSYPSLSVRDFAHATKPGSHPGRSRT